MLHTEETKDKIRKALIGHKVSNETRDKIRLKIKGKIKPNIDNSFIGLTKNRLTALRELPRRIQPNGSTKRVILCRCECGKYVELLLHSFMSGRTKSCGCLQKETIIRLKTKHGDSFSKLNNVFRAVKSRCYNPNNKEYHNYGGRGIIVEFIDYYEFKEWAENNGYKDGLTIERVNVNGNYSIKNCKWIPMSDQAKNMRKTIYIEYNGKRERLKGLCERLNLNYNKVWVRLYKHGYTLDEALKY